MTSRKKLIEHLNSIAFMRHINSKFARNRTGNLKTCSLNCAAKPILVFLRRFGPFNNFFDYAVEPSTLAILRFFIRKQLWPALGVINQLCKDYGSASCQRPTGPPQMKR